MSIAVQGNQVVLSGRLNIETFPEMKAALLDAMKGGAARVTVEASGIEEIDLAALQVLVSAHVSLTRRGGGLDFVNAAEPLREVLHAARLSIDGFGPVT